MGVALAHDQQVRVVGLARQNAALPHAEAVLFVHNGKAEIFEHHAVRQHRMGANHQPGTAIRNGGKGHPLFGGFHAAHQQGNVDAKRLQAVGQVGSVLAGQNSVGASMALCQPFCAANQMAAAATSVLPLPTSPCSRRFIGVSPHRSSQISSADRRCAPVGA